MGSSSELRNDANRSAPDHLHRGTRLQPYQGVLDGHPKTELSHPTDIPIQAEPSTHVHRVVDKILDGPSNLLLRLKKQGMNQFSNGLVV